jgi:hypothetical protein
MSFAPVLHRLFLRVQSSLLLSAKFLSCICDGTTSSRSISFEQAVADNHVDVSVSQPLSEEITRPRIADS